MTKKRKLLIEVELVDEGKGYVVVTSVRVGGRECFQLPVSYYTNRDVVTWEVHKGIAWTLDLSLVCS